MTYRLRILHISDLHERIALDWMPESRRRKIRVSAAGRYRVLEESNFYDTIRAFRARGEIDLVCFTGDVADWGLDAEYEAATARVQKILDASGVDRSRIFVVPGNHDIMRQEEVEVWQAMRTLSATDSVALGQWMAGLDAPANADPRWRDAIAARTAAFWRWVERRLIGLWSAGS